MSGAHGVEPLRRLAQTPHANNDYGGLIVIDRICVCTTAQRWKLTPDCGDRPWASSQNQNILTKSSTFQKTRLRGWSNNKAYDNGSTISLLFPTGGLVNRIWTCDRATNDSAPLQFLPGDIQTWHIERCGEDDSAIRPCVTPSQINLATIKGARISMYRKTENSRRNDGVKTSHPLGTYIHIKNLYLIVKTTIHWPQGMVQVQDLLPPISFRTDESIQHRRK